MAIVCTKITERGYQHLNKIVFETLQDLGGALKVRVVGNEPFELGYIRYRKNDPQLSGAIYTLAETNLEVIPV